MAGDYSLSRCGWSWVRREECWGGGAGGRGWRKARADWRNEKRFISKNREGAGLNVKEEGRNLKGRVGRS